MSRPGVVTMSLNEVAPYLESIWLGAGGHGVKCWTRDYGSRSPAWPQLGEGCAVVEGPGGGRGGGTEPARRAAAGLVYIPNYRNQGFAQPGVIPTDKVNRMRPGQLPPRCSQMTGVEAESDK